MAMAPPRRGLEIPPSSSAVDVYVIDTGARLWGFPGASMMDPVLPGYEDGPEVPSYSFLIRHKELETNLLFDLGLRQDWQSAFPPAFVKGVQPSGLRARVGKDIADLLQDNSVALADIDAVIFSHHHFDHTGDLTKFPSSTKAVVGPGYVKAFLPGWPANRKQYDTTSDLYENRQTIEVDFHPSNPKALSIGGFMAHDYFSDGSFYLLSTPGHTIGHLSALARTTSDENGQSTFIFMGGDIAHTHAVFRPSSNHALPAVIPTPNSPPFISNTQPTEPIAQLHRLYHSHPDGRTLSRTTPFSRVAGPEHDLVASQQSTDKLAANFDGDDNILTVLAHDAGLQDVVEFFPRKANAWKEKGWKRESHWRWLAPCLCSMGEGKGGGVKL